MGTEVPARGQGEVMCRMFSDKGLPTAWGLLYLFRQRKRDNRQGPVRFCPGPGGQTDPAQCPLFCIRMFGGRTENRDRSGSLRDQIRRRFGIKIKVCICGEERWVVCDIDRFDVAAAERYGREGELLVGDSVEEGYVENREDDSVDLVRLDDEDGCLRG